MAKFDLSNLRMMTSGAAPLTQELIEAAYARIKFSTKQDYRLSETSLLRTRSFNLVAAECLSRDVWFRTGNVGEQNAKENFQIADRVKELNKSQGFLSASREEKENPSRR
ncbi:phenylacetyl-CoA ligase [Penicillium subrubescens]|uniref:phenylacetyl-CoA ligase n=1 Tax=Penicillium subrubescens TaxID=1316194 RepID=UPI002544EEE5|nr:phenylacetyl-CoA ligase [Penicillium subrubescens]KAJ5896803.1 phenylacetyl-CoA ligase [Penicillium subrubescens]